MNHNSLIYQVQYSSKNYRFFSFDFSFVSTDVPFSKGTFIYQALQGHLTLTNTVGDSFISIHPKASSSDSLQWQAGSCWSQCWRLRGCCPRIVPRTHSEIACRAPSAAPPPPALAFPGIAPDVLFQSAEDEVSGALKMTVHVAEMPLCGFAWNASVPYHQCAPLGSGQTCMGSKKREMQAKLKKYEEN